MLVVLGDQQKEDLSLLSGFDENVAREFCKIAVGFIQNGINAKMYQTAAAKLGIDSETVRKCVEGLMHLMCETSKSFVNDIDFQDSMMTIGFSESLTAVLLNLYLEHKDEIRIMLDNLSADPVHYNDLEWRFDVQIASRALQYQMSPEIYLRFHLKDGATEMTKIVQTDPVNLVHMTEELDKAIAEIKSVHCRRIMRSIK